MLNEIREKVARQQSFAFETTLSGKAYARHIPEWRSLGFHVSLFFLALDTPEIAIARVATRVAQGGHHVPEATVRRRFDAGLRNFDALYKPLVDHWMLYDNTGDEPLLIDWGSQ